MRDLIRKIFVLTLKLQLLKLKHLKRVPTQKEDRQTIFRSMKVCVDVITIQTAIDVLKTKQ